MLACRALTSREITPPQSSLRNAGLVTSGISDFETKVRGVNVGLKFELPSALVFYLNTTATIKNCMANGFTGLLRYSRTSRLLIGSFDFIENGRNFLIQLLIVKPWHSSRSEKETWEKMDLCVQSSKYNDEQSWKFGCRTTNLPPGFKISEIEFSKFRTSGISKCSRKLLQNTTSKDCFGNVLNADLASK